MWWTQAAKSGTVGGLSRLVSIALVALVAAPARAEVAGDAAEAADEAPDEAAAAQKEAEKRRRGGWVALPGLYYSPDDGLSGAASVMRYYRLDGSERPSKTSVSTALSTRGNGALDFDNDLWLDGDRLNVQLTSKLSYLERAYFGVGNATPKSAREDYTAWRIDARLEVARRLPHDLYIAPIYDFRWQRMESFEPGGALESGAVPGAESGFLSAVGVEFRVDTRDSIFYPTRGVKVQASPRLYHRVFGSDHDFVRYFVDASAYFELPWPLHVLALDARADFRWGDPPFDHLSMAGGNRLLRGMLEGRFRDDHYLAAQAEYRFPVYWRFGAVAFAGVGRVAGALDDFDLGGWKPSVGGGVRFAFDEEERINLRADFGITSHGSGAYLNVLEAF